MSKLLQRITVEPGKLGGRPCIRGMRVGVEHVLEMLDSGMTEEDILREFPYLEVDDIRAAVEYSQG